MYIFASLILLSCSPLQNPDPVGSSVLHQAERETDMACIQCSPSSVHNTPSPHDHNTPSLHFHHPRNGAICTHSLVCTDRDSWLGQVVVRSLNSPLSSSVHFNIKSRLRRSPNLIRLLSLCHAQVTSLIT